MNEEIQKICHSCLCENNCAYIRKGLINKCKDIINYLDKNKSTNKKESVNIESIYNTEDRW